MARGPDAGWSRTAPWWCETETRGHLGQQTSGGAIREQHHRVRSLRSIADNTAELERAIASGDVKVPEGADPAQERQLLLAVANRPTDGNTTFSTGGDVSRFQRRTVPARAEDAARAIAAGGSARGYGGGNSPRRSSGGEGTEQATVALDGRGRHGVVDAVARCGKVKSR